MKFILAGPAYPLRGGIAHFNESLANALLNRSFETKIVSFYYQYPSLLFPGKTQYSNSKAPENLIIKSLISSINPFSWIRTANYIKKESPDYIIIQFWIPFMAPSLGSIARLIRRNHTAKIIAIMHNVIPHERSVFDKMLTKYFINACHGFICLSESVAVQLRKLTNKSLIKTIPHPIYNIFGEKITKAEARNFLNLNQNEKIILFFGIIRKYKGLELLLKAMSEEKIKKLNIKLLVAGEFYEDKSQYLELIDKLNIKDNIIFIDKYIPNDEVKYYFCAADLVVQPYLSATQSGVTQIAYNFEKPVLVTNVGSLAEFVKHQKTGYVVSVSYNEVANAIEDFFINNRELEFSKNIINEKHRFSWDYFVDNLLNFYST